MAYRDGDRVRILKTPSAYTGCRGTVVDQEGSSVIGASALGHFVAIDGENGRVRPFLVQDLEPLRPAPVRRPSAGRSSETGSR